MSSEETVVASEGTVKWYNQEKGYGFIQLPDGGKDVFIHVKELQKAGIVALHDGAALVFTTNEGPKGLYATDIRVTQNAGLESKAKIA